MFTGIITDIGIILAAQLRGEEMHLRIQTAYDTSNIALGASIACSGICLTVTELGKHWFAAIASSETRRITTLNHWQEGMPINLERALKMGDELGGHLVSGHVDGLAQLTHIQPNGESWQLTLRAPSELSPYIARKGSVTLDGISLTVNEAGGDDFSVMIIPHTWQHTTLQHRGAGDKLNLEVDLFARYLERLREKG